MLREEGQTHPVVLSHNDLNVTTVAISGGSMGEGDRPPTRVVSEEFFGNQFSQFVVIFLFQGLRNYSPITMEAAGRGHNTTHWSSICSHELAEKGVEQWTAQH